MLHSLSCLLFYDKNSDTQEQNRDLNSSLTRAVHCNWPVGRIRHIDNIDKTEKNLYKNSNQIEYDIYTALNERREISMFV